MGEDPKSIWKGSFTGKTAVTIWAAGAGLFVVLASLAAAYYLPVSDMTRDRLLGVVIGIPICAAAYLLLCHVAPQSMRLMLSMARLMFWKHLRWTLFGLACFAVLIGLVYIEEDLRGWYAWNSYRRELEARGEQLDFKAFIPKPVPDEQNFAATPLIKSWFAKPGDAATGKCWNWKVDNFFQVETRVPRYHQDNKCAWQFVDLVAWETAFDALRAGELNQLVWGRTDSGLRVGIKNPERFPSGRGFGRPPAPPDGGISWRRVIPWDMIDDPESRKKAALAVLEELKTNEAVFAELRAASQHTCSRYPVNYDMENPSATLLPHLSNVKNACRRLQLKACAELAARRSDDALDDVKLMFYMADSVKEEPSVISHLVRINCLNLAIQPIWEGLAERAWSDAQLQKLQTDLRQYDVVRDLKRSLDAERAWNILTIDLGRRRPVLLLEIYGESPTSTRRSLVNLIGRVVPRGWYYQEQLNYCRLDQILLAGVFDKNGKLLLPSRIESSGREFYERVFPERTAFKLVLHHRFMASELLAGPGSFTACRFGWTQTAIDQAALGCALERYRLASGEFPENLDAVVPKFIAKLPRDVINGQPVHYHLTNGRQFVLYSVGWNEKDDGGAPGKGIFDSVNGDWVWQYPAPH